MGTRREYPICSCRRAPPERIVGVGKTANRFARLLDRQDLVADLLQEIGGNARRRRGRVERPAEMLARVTQSDAQPVMGEHLFIEIDDERELLAERGRGLAPAGLQVARDLPGKPWPPLCGAA